MKRSPSHRRGFTLVELLMVMVVIAILAGLVLGTAGYVQKTAARKKAGAQIAAFEAAMEGYKADNGIYPRSSSTDSLNAQTMAPTAAANLVLYRALSGDCDLNRKLEAADGARDLEGTALSPVPASPVAPKQYMEIKPDMVTPSGGTGTVTGLVDPFGSIYGYGTANQADSTKGYNPTFDLWSTAGAGSAAANSVKWVKNW